MNERAKALKDLDQIIWKKSVAICNTYLENLFTLVPDVKYARNSFEFENPYPHMPGAENHFDLVNMLDQLSEFEEMMPTISKKFNIPDKFIPSYKANSLKELKDKLITDNKLTTFKSLRKEDIKASGWLATITSFQGLDMFNNGPKVKDGKIYLDWSSSTFSYLRDFELLVKLVIDASLENNTMKTYAEKIQTFFSPIQNTIFENYAKPYVRSKIAHQLYLVNIIEQKIVFFKDENYSRSVEKELSLQKLLEMTVNISLLLWSCLLVLCDRHDFTIEFIEEEIIRQVKSQSLFKELQDVKAFNVFNVTNFEKELSKSRPLYESYLMIKLFLTREMPSLLFFMQMQTNVAYLMSYSLVEERLIKPLAKTYNETIDLGSIRDKEMVVIIQEKVGPEIRELLEDFRPDDRNVLAHLDYYRNDNDLRLYRDEQKEHPLNVNSMSLMNLFNKVEFTFDEKRIDIPKFMAIGQLLNEIYYHPIAIDTSREKIVKETILRMERNFYPLISIYLLVSALSCDTYSMAKTIERAIDSKYFRKDDIKIIWASIYTYARRILNEQNIHKIFIWIRAMLGTFDSIPISKEDIEFVDQIKSFFNLFIS